MVPRRRIGRVEYVLAGSSEERKAKLLVAIKKMDTTWVLLHPPKPRIAKPLTELERFEKGLLRQLALFRNNKNAVKNGSIN